MAFPAQNKSPIESYGRYGYFNSHRAEAIDPNTGETIYTYDRCYTNEDMNEFMRGLVGMNGLFNQSGTQLSSDPRTDRQYTACRVTINQNNYKLDEPVGEYPANTLFATLNPGKGLVNYHWFQIDSDMPIYFSDEEQSIYDRADKVSVRWDQNDRKCIVWVEKGTPTQGLTDGSEIGTKGMIQNRSWTTNVGFAIKTDPITTHTIMEITLGYMYIRSVTWRQQHPNKAPMWFRDLRGGQYCPWITHLAAGPSSKDLDEKIRQYNDVIEEWIANLTSGGDLGMKLSTVKLHVNGNDGIPNYIDLTSAARNAGYENYTYSSEHTVLVYYNGLIMSAENGEFQFDSTVADRVIINNGTTTSGSIEGNIPVNNMVDIVIFVGSTLSIPNGDNIRY